MSETFKVLAVDEEGNTFEKNVSVFKHRDKWIVDFGFPIQYRFEVLYEHVPYQKPLSIDIGGKMHKGKKVVVVQETMDALMEWAKNQIIIQGGKV